MTHPQTQDDEALVEVIGRALEDAWNHSFVDGELSDLPPIELTKVERDHLATAALTALRNHEGRK